MRLSHLVFALTLSLLSPACPADDPDEQADMSRNVVLPAAPEATPATTAELSPEETLKREISALRSKRAELLSRYTAQHPEVRIVNRQIKNLEALQADQSSR